MPHPRIAQRQHEKPVKVDDERVGVNGKIALIITAVVGTMWCAYVFAIHRADRHRRRLCRTVVRRSSSSALDRADLLQLVLLPIIIVGQNIQGKASDKRSEQTYKDAEAILSECLQLQSHLQAQDIVLDDVIAHVKQHHWNCSGCRGSTRSSRVQRPRSDARRVGAPSVTSAGVAAPTLRGVGLRDAVAGVTSLTCALGPDAAGTMVSRLLRGARVSIDAALYEVGPSYRWELVRAARRGVRVRLVLDAHGSDGNAATARELTAAGGECRVAGGHGRRRARQAAHDRRDRRGRHRQPDLARCATRPAPALSTRRQRRLPGLASGG